MIPSTPEEYIQVSQKMKGSNFSFEWIEKPNAFVKKQQTVRVKVTDTLDEYVHVKEINLIFEAEEKPLSLNVPTSMDFGNYQLGSATGKLYWDKRQKNNIQDESN